MALEIRIAFAVFAVGVLIAIVALAGCGGDDEENAQVGGGGQSALPTDQEKLRVPAACEGRTRPQRIVAGRVLEGGLLRAIYVTSGSLPPCAVYVSGGANGLEVAVRVPVLPGITDDIEIWCAELQGPAVPPGTPIEGRWDQRTDIAASAFEGKLAHGSDCRRVPYHEEG